MTWYKAGTVTVTAGSTTVTGASTRFVENLMVGDIFYGPDNRLYEITNVASNTSIAINPAYKGSTAAGQAYSVIYTQARNKQLADRAASLIGGYDTAKALAEGSLQKADNLGGLTDKAAARGNLMLGSAATRDVGTGGGNVMEVGAFGVGGIAGNTNENKGGLYAFHEISLPANYPSGEYPYGTVIRTSHPYVGGYSEIVITDGIPSKLMYRHSKDVPFKTVYDTGNLPATATRWPSWDEVSSKPTFGNASTATLTAWVGPSESHVITQKGVTDFLVSKGLGESTVELAADSGSGLFRVVEAQNLQNPPPGYTYGTLTRVLHGYSGWVSDLYIPHSSNSSAMSYRGSTNEQWRTVRDSLNTTVDGSGFIKAASPILNLYPNKIEQPIDGYLELENVAFERVDVGHYVISSCPKLAAEGWYLEQPKDRNNNIYHTCDWEYDADTRTLTVRTYEPDYSSGRAENGAPVDIKDGRFIALRFAEDPSLYPEPDLPDPEQTEPEEPTA